LDTLSLGSPLTSRSLSRVVAVYVIAFAVFSTWPGMVPFNRVEPFVLGMPFNLVWIAGWVLLSFLLLALLEVVRTREEDAK